MSLNQKDQFQKYLLASLAGHFGIFLVFTVKAFFLPSEPVVFKSAIRVDVVGLPEKTKPRTQKTKAKPAAPKVDKKQAKLVKPKQKKTAKPKVNLNKAKTRQQKALERLKALEALENMKKEVEAEKVKETAQEPKPTPPQEFKGNIVASGSSLSGLDRLAFERYYDGMSAHVKSHWSLPNWLASANLKAEAAVTIDERGYVTSQRIYSSSGNDVFDNLVMETVEKASPFPEPPSRLRSVLALKGMILGFPE